MKKSLSIMAVAMGLSSFAAIAYAQTINIEPGEWQYSANGVLGPIPFSERGTECIAPDEASADLEELVAGLDANCAISNVAQDGSKLTAALVCEGSLSLTADLDMDVTGSAARVNVTGQMTLGEGLEFPVDLSGTAVRTGAC